VHNDFETLSEIFGGFYDAALGVWGWDEALTAFINHAAPRGFDLCFLLWEAAGQPGAQFVGAVNLADFAREIYVEKFAGQHPWSRSVVGRRVGVVLDTDEVCPRPILIESEIYQCFLSNWGLTRALIGLLDRERERHLGVVLIGEDGVEIDGLRRDLRLALPHLQRATRIGRRIAGTEERAATAEAALAASHAAVIALRADLSIINANPAALALIEKGVAQNAAGRFRFADRASQAALERFANDPLASSTAFNVATASADYAALGIVISAGRADALGGFLREAAILLTLAQKARAPAIPVDHLAAWYGLTPTEARLAAALADGATVARIAQERGVTENAVRFVLKNVLRKTGAPDQARLVAALRSLPVSG
jgi:DNA-binding CsgD family transcriptional regulator/PAS domain-containing protein